MKKSVTWADLIILIRQGHCNVDFESFSNMTGISVERLKEIEEGTAIPNEEEVKQISNTSDFAKRLVELFDNDNLGLPCEDQFVVFSMGFVKKLCGIK